MTTEEEKRLAKAIAWQKRADAIVVLAMIPVALFILLLMGRFVEWVLR